MRKLHKGLIIGGATLAVLVPAGMVLADQLGDGPHRGNGRGNGTEVQDRLHQQVRNQDEVRVMDQVQNQDQVRTQDQVRARDGSGVNHEANAATAQTRTETHTQQHDGPQNGTGQQQRNGR